MLRSFFPALRQTTAVLHSLRPLSLPSPSSSPTSSSAAAPGPRPSPLSSARTAALRQWTSDLARSTLDKSRAGCDVRFDRSGGKGGQNVNKLNTKATLTVDLGQAHWISPELIPALKSSPYYAPTSHTLVLTGSAQRLQPQNLAEAFSKLRSHLLELARPLMPGETTEATRERVKGHQARFERRVREEKGRRSEIKKGRSTKGQKFED